MTREPMTGWFATVLAFAALSMLFNRLSRRPSSLAEKGAGNPYMRGPRGLVATWGRRLDFTREGWRFRNLFVACQVLSFAAILAAFLSTCGAG